jgi:two-component system chemotaxis response regulator CheB
VTRLLVVDDSALLRKLIGQVFSEDAQFEVRFARNGLEALSALTEFRPDVITLDVEMPGIDGLTCLDRIMVDRPTPVVMVSSLTAAGAEITLEALRMGAVDFVQKPIGAVSLHMEQWGPALRAKVEAAVGAKVRSSARLAERIRNQTRKLPTPMRPPARRPAVDGEGLVLIGSSTGGPPALETVLSALPADFPLPILVAQHIPASFTGPLARRLDGVCALSVVEVARPMPMTPGTVYIGRGDADVVVSRRVGVLTALSTEASDYPWHPSTDRMVTSAMNHLPAEQLIGVLLTGMGNDGAQAMTTMRHAGGRTIAEAEETAVVWGMPGELVKAGGAEAVEPLGQIGSRLIAMLRCP